MTKCSHIIGTLVYLYFIKYSNALADPESSIEQVWDWKEGPSCYWQLCRERATIACCCLSGGKQLVYYGMLVHIQSKTLLNFFVVKEVPEGTKESPGGPWQFIGLLPLFDPPRHDSAETIRRALDLGVSVKIITGASFYALFNIC